MKKILSLVLAFALVLSVASVAFAAWKDVDTATVAGPYKITVSKFTSATDAIGNSYVLAGENAGSVSGLIIYYSVAVTVPETADGVADLSDVNVKADDASTAEGATIKVSFGSGLKALGATLPLADPAAVDKATGDVNAKIPAPTTSVKTYYLNASGEFTSTKTALPLVVTDTAKATISAKLTYNAPLATGTDFNNDRYEFGSFAAKNSFVFMDTKGEKGTYTLLLNDSNKVKSISVSFPSPADAPSGKLGYGPNGKLTAGGEELSTAQAEDVAKVLALFGEDTVAGVLNNVKITLKNIRANLTNSFVVSSNEAVWGAYTPDPVVVAIPKTGDNTSVIGFAMVMIALVAAAVAVKKVKA